MARQSAEIEQALGVDLFPGSLNVCLTKPILLNGSNSIVYADDRMLWPGSIDGLAVWLYRWPTAPLHVVEIVAKESLRNRLDLMDGGIVTLRVDSEVAAPPPLRQSVISTALWAGRRDWYYTNEKYTRWAGRHERRHGAVQGKPARRPGVS